MTVHLRIYKLTNIMTTIWPLENTETIYLTLDQVATVYENIVVLVWVTIPPLFKAFAIYMSVFEHSSDLNLSII